MQNKVLTEVQDVKFPFWRNLLFGLSGFSRMLASALISTYAVYYYTDILGMSGRFVGAIVLISKIWDIINDPMMGAIVDRTRSREGKCRYWLKYFSVPGGIVLASMFIVPDFGSGWQMVWFAVTYIVQAMFHTVLCIPANALIGRISSNKVERGKINQVFMIFCLLGSNALTAFALPMVEFFGKGDLHTGFAWAAVVFGAVYAIGFITAAAAAKGYEPLEYLAEDAEAKVHGEQRHKVKISDTIRALATNGYWLLCAGVTFFSVLGEGTGLNAMVQHLQYNLGNTDLMTLYSGISTVMSVLSILSISLFVKKLGNAGTVFVGAILAVLGWGMRFVLADSSVAVYAIGTVIATYGSGLVSSLAILCLFDARVYGEYKTGIDNDAILMSGNTTASKIGFAIGPSIGAMLLDSVGYLSQAEVQSEAACRLFLIENTLVPALGHLLVGICAFFMMRLEKRIPEMMQALHERKVVATDE